MKVRFIINPCSGRNRGRPWLVPAVREFARRELADSDVCVTEYAGHATELARAAVRDRATLVAAAGGDGTMNEVAQALTNTPTALALLPCGSGNGLALHLGLPRSIERALRLLVDDSHRCVAIDSGLANDRPFFNAMGCGFDAEVSGRFNALARRGLPAYLRATFAAVRDARPQRCTISSGDQHTTLDALLVAVANSDQYGNHAVIAPGARVDDGRMDLIAIRSAGLLRLAALAPRLFLRNLDHSPLVTRLRGETFTIERASAGPMHTDGETHPAAARLVVRVLPRSLRVLVPATSCVAAQAASAGSFALHLP